MLQTIVRQTQAPPVQLMTELDDSVLLQRCSEGEITAFETLYRRYHLRIYRFVIRMLNNNELAEEAVVDTLHAVWKNSASFRGNSAVSSWILGIAYKTALKTLDRNARHTRNRENAEQLDNFQDDNPSHDPQMITSLMDDTERVLSAITKLSPEHQAVVTLTANGHSCEEIAEIVECPKNTVKTRMFHARKQLQRLLGSELPSYRLE